MYLLWTQVVPHGCTCLDYACLLINNATPLGNPRRTPVLEALHDVEIMIMKEALLLLEVVNVEKHVFTRTLTRL